MPYSYSQYLLHKRVKDKNKIIKVVGDDRQLTIGKIFMDNNNIMLFLNCIDWTKCNAATGHKYKL